MKRRTRHLGFTLIEMLLVVAILSAATAATIGVAGPMSAGQKREAAAARVVEAIERTRLLAQRTGGATLMLGETLVATPTRESPALESIRTTLPSGWSASARDGAARPEESGSLTFGADGVCEDALIDIEGPKDAHSALRVHGISGQVTRSPESEAAP